MVRDSFDLPTISFKELHDLYEIMKCGMNVNSSNDIWDRMNNEGGLWYVVSKMFWDEWNARKKVKNNP